MFSKFKSSLDIKSYKLKVLYLLNYQPILHFSFGKNQWSQGKTNTLIKWVNKLINYMKQSPEILLFTSNQIILFLAMNV